jgi:hypothetical protein
VRDIHTVDFAIAWSPQSNVPLDLGINVGLVPAAVPYAGGPAALEPGLPKALHGIGTSRFFALMPTTGIAGRRHGA